MKHLNLWKSTLLLFALVVGSTCAWGDTVTFDATKDVDADASPYQATEKSYTATDGSTWKANGYGATKETCLTIGKGGANYLLTPDVAGTISSVAVTWYGNDNYYLALQTTTGTELEAKSNPSTETTQTFSVTGSYSQLKLVGRRASGTSNAAATITKVVVTYTPSGGPTTYSVFYDGNGATSGTAPTDETAYSSGASVTVKGNTGSLARTGFIFDGWNTKADGTGTDYSADDSFTITANTTLYAKWNFVVTDGFFDFVNAAKQEPLEDYGSGMTLVSSDYTTTEKTWTAGNVTMETSRVSGNGYRWWEADGTLRFYNGSKATFSVPSGYVITKIVTTGANFDSASPSGLSGATWTGASNEVALSVTDTRNIKTITVTYTTENQTITPAKQYTTLTSAYNLDFTGIEGLKAYIATEVAGGKVNMTQVNKVPAGTGLVLKATTPGAAVNVPVFDGTSPDNVSANKMAGSATNTTAIADDGGYILKDGVFQPASAGTLPAGKAYLNIAVASAHPLSLDFGDGDVTGIENLTIMPSRKGEGMVYDLQGRRVAQPAKGLYIVNGKKVFVP